MDNGTRQTLADPLALGKAADNKHAERIDEIIGRLLSQDAHGEHAVQLSGALLRPIHGRTDVEALLSVASRQRESVIPRPEAVGFDEPVRLAA